MDTSSTEIYTLSLHDALPILYAYKVWKASRGAEVLYAQDTASVGLPTVLANLFLWKNFIVRVPGDHAWEQGTQRFGITRSEEHTSELQSHVNLVCRLLLEKKK